MIYAQLRGSGFFEGRNRIPEDELSRIEHLGEGFKKFLPQRLVLALEVEHRDRKGFNGLWHGFMVTAGQCWSYVTHGTVQISPRS